MNMKAWWIWSLGLYEALAWIDKLKNGKSFSPCCAQPCLFDNSITPICQEKELLTGHLHSILKSLCCTFSIKDNIKETQIMWMRNKNQFPSFNFAIDSLMLHPEVVLILQIHMLPTIILSRDNELVGRHNLNAFGALYKSIIIILSNLVAIIAFRHQFT